MTEQNKEEPNKDNQIESVGDWFEILGNKLTTSTPPADKPTKEEIEKINNELEGIFDWLGLVTEKIIDSIKSEFDIIANSAGHFIYMRLIGDKIEALKLVAEPMAKKALATALPMAQKAIATIENKLVANPEIKSKIELIQHKWSELTNKFEDPSKLTDLTKHEDEKKLLEEQKELLKELKEVIETLKKKIGGGKKGGENTKPRLNKNIFKKRMQTSLKNFHKTNNLLLLRKEIKRLTKKYSRK